jgi:hypothetical protein
VFVSARRNLFISFVSDSKETSHDDLNGNNAFGKGEAFELRPQFAAERQGTSVCVCNV